MSVFDVIVVGGGLSALPDLYKVVPERWLAYTVSPALRTRFIPAHHGAMSGLRGAAWLGRDD